MAGYKGTQGRRPTPTALKLLRGNPSKTPIHADPIPPQGEIIVPSWLTEAAAKIFSAYQPILEGMQVLTVADRSASMFTSATEAEFIELEQDIQENGRSRKIFTAAGEKWAANPAVAQRSDAGKRLKSLMIEFGMSPSSRTRLETRPKADEEDPFAQFERQA